MRQNRQKHREMQNTIKISKNIFLTIFTHVPGVFKHFNHQIRNQRIKKTQNMWKKFDENETTKRRKMTKKFDFWSNFNSARPTLWPDWPKELSILFINMLSTFSKLLWDVI
jgi:hypothetical protein